MFSASALKEVRPPRTVAVWRPRKKNRALRRLAWFIGCGLVSLVVVSLIWELVYLMRREK